MTKLKKALLGIAAVGTMLTGCAATGNLATMPFSYNEAAGENYEDAVKQLKEAGFTNIITDTISTYSKNDNGEIAEITVNGDHLFSAGTYSKDAEIKIRYRELVEPKKEQEKADKEQTKDTEEEKQDKATMGDVYLMITNAMTTTYGENYEASYDESGITVNVWEDGTAETAVLAKNGDREAQEKWDNMVESIKQMTEATKEKIMQSNGYGDKMFVINVLNDAKKEATILTVSDGVVFYDVVNEVDLLNTEQ